MYILDLTKKFKKSFKRVKKNPRFKDEIFQEVVGKLLLGEKLDSKFKDHQLTGRLKDYRECHLAPDILLMYEYRENILYLILTNIGSHSELF